MTHCNIEHVSSSAQSMKTSRIVFCLFHLKVYKISISLTLLTSFHLPDCLTPVISPTEYIAKIPLVTMPVLIF